MHKVEICHAVTPLIGWDTVNSGPAQWSFGIPDSHLLPDIQGLITNPSFPLTRERLTSMPNLVVVSSYGVGYDYIDVEAASELGILVTHTPHAVTQATAELGLTLVLALMRHIVIHDRAVRQESNSPHPMLSHHAILAHDASSQTVGLVGYGRIGQRLGQLLDAVGFQVLYTRAHGPLADHPGYRDLHSLLEEADIVVLALPLTPDTRHVLNSSTIKLMKPTAQIVNIGRGPCIDERALVGGLQTQQIAGAALDVFEFEPRVSKALLHMPQVILSPHVGTLTKETRIEMTRDAVSNILAALDGCDQNAVNAQYWTRRPH